MEGETEVEPVVNPKAQKAGEELTKGMLMDQVEELEEQKTKLLLTLKEYKEKYEQQKSDQTDIYYYLNKKLDENYETIASLEEQILNEQTQREVQERKLEKRVEELLLKVANDESKYLTKLNEAEEKLQKLKEFSENKDELERNFDKLLETLESERAHYRELADENERKSIRDRDRFRKDCEKQFEDYKQKIQDEADEKLSSKAKKTLKTNKMIKTELLYQSKQADQVLVYNQKVLDKDRELRQELELTQTTQKEMVKRLALYQRLIKQLNEKVSNQEMQIRELREEHTNDNKLKDDEIVSLQSDLKKVQAKYTPRRKSGQDTFLDFLSSKYKEMTGKQVSKAFIADNSVEIMNNLLVLALEQFPERFAGVLEGKPPVGFFPPINGGNSLHSTTDRDYSSEKPNKLLTGISAWDSARSSSKQNWWSAFSNEVDSEMFSQGNMTSHIGIQTEGRILHYPAGSKWLDRKNSESVAGSMSTKYFINHEGRRIKHKTAGSSSQRNIVDGRLDAKSVEERLLDDQSSSGMFSPVNDPLLPKSKKGLVDSLASHSRK